MSKYKLTSKPIVDVKVNLSLKSAARKGFNLGFILVNIPNVEDEEQEQIIPKSERVRIYTAPDDMLADGFVNTDAAYKAAQLYFMASSAPGRLAVGGRYQGETALEAFTACRLVNSEWYCGVVLGALESEIKEIAAYVESCEPSTLFLYTTHDTNCLQRTIDPESEAEVVDIFTFLKDRKYRRSFGQYCGDSDTQDAVVATMGYAMGANTGAADSAYTLAYKTLVGIPTDDLSNSQVEYVCGSKDATGNNGNVYITRAEEYDILQQGYMADKTSFDEILNLDMLRNEITLNIMDLLYQSKKIPQTTPGVNTIINVINVACNKFVNNGFIAPGKWNGAKCLNLNKGDYLPDGYLVQAEPIDEQSQADRDARKAPPIYVCCKLAGAIEFVTVEVNVNR